MLAILIVLIVIVLTLMVVVFLQYKLWREIKGYRLDFISTFDSSFKEKVKKYFIDMRMREEQIEIKNGKVEKYVYDRDY